ncbi:MAG: hypothetical protein L5655_11920, partial [Thermosediminibacteraceae bacterium]|nr:hypothetical protein [Thermosediminibacteraceae bacterium]
KDNFSGLIKGEEQMSFIFNKFVLFFSTIFVILFAVNLYKPTAIELFMAILGGFLLGIIPGMIFYVLSRWKNRLMK